MKVKVALDALEYLAYVRCERQDCNIPKHRRVLYPSHKWCLLLMISSSHIVG